MVYLSQKLQVLICTIISGIYMTSESVSASYRDVTKSQHIRIFDNVVSVVVSKGRYALDSRQRRKQAYITRYALVFVFGFGLCVHVRALCMCMFE